MELSCLPVAEGRRRRVELVADGNAEGDHPSEANNADDPDDETGYRQSLATLRSTGIANLPTGDHAEDDCQHRAKAEKPEDGDDERRNGETIGAAPNR